MLIDTYCSAIAGTLLGYALAHIFATVRCRVAPGLPRIEIEVLVWLCLLMACFIILTVSPLPAAKE